MGVLFRTFVELAILVLGDQVEHLKDLIWHDVTLLVALVAQLAEDTALDDLLWPWRPRLLLLRGICVAGLPTAILEAVVERVATVAAPLLVVGGLLLPRTELI